MADTRRSHVGPLAVFTGPNRHTEIGRWFATAKVFIQQQTDGSLHFAEEQLSSANLLSHAPGRTRCKSFQCALRSEQWRQRRRGSPSPPALWRAAVGEWEARSPSRRCRERPISRPGELAVAGVRFTRRLSTEVALAGSSDVPNPLRGTDRRLGGAGELATSNGGLARRWRAATEARCC